MTFSLLLSVAAAASPRCLVSGGCQRTAFRTTARLRPRPLSSSSSPSSSLFHLLWKHPRTRESSLDDSVAALVTAMTVVVATSFCANNNDHNHNTTPVHPIRMGNGIAKSSWHDGDSPMLATSSADATRITTTTTTTTTTRNPTTDSPATDTPILLDCDFVIVGHGNAGRAAVQQIRQLCPKATVAVIDPSVATWLRSPRYQKSPQVRYVAASATALDHAQQVILVHNGAGGIRYRHSVLIATGSRGSPPPQTLVHPEAAGRILELRSTEVLHNGSPTTGSQEEAASQLDSNPHPETTPHERRSVLPKEGVRQLSLLAASQGASICVVGSGLEAIELAASIAQARSSFRPANGTPPSSASSSSSSSSSLVSKTTQRTRRKQSERMALPHKTTKNTARTVTTPYAPQSTDQSKTVLLFGNAGPLSDRIPRYMSRAVAARLQNSGMDVLHRSLVRYVLLSTTPHQSTLPPTLEIHAARSYDHLETNRISADLMIVAPIVEGQKGTAVLPTVLNDSSSVGSTVSYRPWSEVTHPRSDPVLTCYSDDGRIMVNAELNAASSVYAAGSVAKYPDNLTGHATVAGEGIVTGSQAGVVAAVNMVREYAKAQSNGSSTTTTPTPTIPSAKILTTNSLPIWRTDIVHPEPLHQVQSPSATATPSGCLKSLGIHALAVGECDSETLAIHGFWWTNRSSTRRDTASPASHRKGPSPNATRPVYASGVVFYLDRAGRLRGVMIWGLPFTTQKAPDGEEVLNEALVERMREMIRSNGSISLPQRMELSGDFHDDNGLLTSRHLSEESIRMASLALRDAPPNFRKSFAPTISQRSLKDPHSAAARPLHLYTPAKPSSVTNIGILRRRIETGNGSMGEDLFTRSGEGDTRPDFDENARPVSLIYVSPMDFAPNPIVAMAPHKDSGKELRGRPPKEEILWLRDGDKNRYTSALAARKEVFMTNLLQGRFANGEDAVQQAPVPEGIVKMKERMREFFSGDAPAAASSNQESEEQ